MKSEEAARKLGVEAASLSPAPAAPRFAQTWAQMQQEPPCSSCGRPSRTSVIHDPDHGSRWLDRCRECFLATPPTLQVPPGRFLEELGEVAAEVGLRAVLYTDEDGWQTS